MSTPITVHTAVTISLLLFGVGPAEVVGALDHGDVTGEPVVECVDGVTGEPVGTCIDEVTAELVVTCTDEVTAELAGICIDDVTTELGGICTDEVTTEAVVLSGAGSGVRVAVTVTPVVIEEPCHGVLDCETAAELAVLNELLATTVTVPVDSEVDTTADPLLAMEESAGVLIMLDDQIILEGATEVRMWEVCELALLVIDV
eukprot:scpid45812/ scgid35590/ 